MENFGFVLEKMAFKSMSKKDLINKIVDEVVGCRDMTSFRYKSPVGRIGDRIDHYAVIYGNLGYSRRKLEQLCIKELKRRERRTAKQRWEARSAQLRSQQ